MAARVRVSGSESPSRKREGGEDEYAQVKGARARAHCVRTERERFFVSGQRAPMEVSGEPRDDGDNSADEPDGF